MRGFRAWAFGLLQAKGLGDSVIGCKRARLHAERDFEEVRGCELPQQVLIANI